MRPTTVAVLLLLLAVLFGCKKKDEVIATLSTATGMVERDHAAAVGRWNAGAVGDVFTMGDGVRTSAASKAALLFGDGGELSMDPKTLLRFLARKPGSESQRLRIEMGEATLRAGARPLGVETDLGMLNLGAGSRVRLARAGSGTRFEVVIGSAELATEKEKFELSVGDAVEISSDGAPAERVPRPDQPPPPPAASSVALAPTPAPAASDGVEAPTAGARSRGPEVVDFVATAGDSFTVHDPRPPTAIRFVVSGKCSGGAVARLDPGRAQSRETVGEGSVGLELSAGSHRYTVACLSDEKKTVAEGSVSVVRDAGSRRLATGAPVTSVDTDGRHYTVLYQSRLPKLSVRWPGAPSSGSFELSLTSQGNARRFSTHDPSYSFASGALSEGDHQLFFTGGAQRSKTTTVTIRFDNAAPTASIASPADGAFAPGASVLVSGTSLPGYAVAVAGQELPQDDQSRFSGEVSAPAGQRALAIRFSQSGRGSHYYLRRSAR